MSLLRQPHEKPQVKPVISMLLPPDLEALKKAFRKELNGHDQLLGKIMQNIHSTVNKMHTDPEEMWLHVDFQEEAINQMIEKFCADIQTKLESKSPPDTFEEEEGIHYLVQQLRWDLNHRYCVEDYVEELLNELSQKGPETLSPEELLKLGQNPHINPHDYNIAGYPGRPLPTGSWWLHPHVNQGCYLIKNGVHGIEFSQAEQQGQISASILVAGAREHFSSPPTVASYDDLCATLHYQAEEASMTVPLLRGSPYITLLYRHCTPSLRIAERGIDPASIQAHAYYLVVPDDQLVNPRTQISLSKAQERGIPARTGEAVLLPNKENLEGQVFIFQVQGTQESYYVFSSEPIRFTMVASEKEGTINALEGVGPCTETTLRIAKLPAGSGLEEGASQLLQHAWVYATGGRMSVTGRGCWKYTYTLQQINPFAHLQPVNPPQAKKQELLIALLQPDDAALTSETPKTSLFYSTILGPAHFAIAIDQELHFSQKVALIHRSDASIARLNEEERRTLATSFIHAAEQLDLKARGASTLQAARNIQSASEAAHAMFTLLRSDRELIDNTLFMEAFQTALSIAKAGLDDYLSGGFLCYDAKNRMVVTALSGDTYNAHGEDLHRAFGHLVRSAADIHEITPDWFDKRRQDIIDLLINEICCPYDQSPYFSKMRILDPYTGMGTGREIEAAPPQPGEVSEDLNCLYGIALWAKTSNNKQLEHFAATLAGRLSSATHPLPDPTSVNRFPFLPENTDTNALQFWLEKSEKWLHSPNLTEDSRKIAESLHKEILTLVTYKGTIQDLHLWAHSIVLPSIRKNSPAITFNDLYPFCVITQTDPQEALKEHAFQLEAPNTDIFQTGSPQQDLNKPLVHPLETPPTPSLFSSSEAFIHIKAEITTYLSERTISLYQAEAFLGLAQEIPSTDTDWHKLTSLAQFKLQQLESDIASCRKPSHWTALAAKYGFRGKLYQIQKQAAYALKILSDLFSARLAISYFLQALAKITTMEMTNASEGSLSEWAQEFDTSGLTPHDLAVWKLMETI